MNTKFLFLFLSISVLVVSCKKESNSTISIGGTISDASGTVSGAQVGFYVKEISGGTFSSTFSNFHNTNSASNGTYEYTFEAKNAVEYKIEVSGENRFENEIIIQPDDLSRDVVNTYNFELTPQAWYKVKIRNSTPFDSTDLMQYQISNSQPDCPGCCNSLVQVYEGDTIDSTIKCMTTGNAMVNISWVVTKNSIVQSFSDSIYCAIGDTGIYTLNY